MSQIRFRTNSTEQRVPGWGGLTLHYACKGRLCSISPIISLIDGTSFTTRNIMSDKTRATTELLTITVTQRPVLDSVHNPTRNRKATFNHLRLGLVVHFHHLLVASPTVCQHGKARVDHTLWLPILRVMRLLQLLWHNQFRASPHGKALVGNTHQLLSHSLLRASQRSAPHHTVRLWSYQRKVYKQDL